MTIEQQHRDEFEEQEIFEHVQHEIMRNIRYDVNTFCINNWETTIKIDKSWEEECDETPAWFDRYVIGQICLDDLRDVVEKRILDPVDDEADDETQKKVNETVADIVGVCETGLFALKCSALRNTPLWNVSFVSQFIMDCIESELVGMMKLEDCVQEPCLQKWIKQRGVPEDQ